MNDVEAVFQRYEAVRQRISAIAPVKNTIQVPSILEIADEADAFVFDAFGVLNVGEQVIEGASSRLDELRAMGKAIRILTNAASYDRAGAVAKFSGLGIRVLPDEIITSRDAALASVTPGLWGCVAASNDNLTDIPASVRRLEDNPDDYNQVNGFLFLSSESWTDERQARLANALRDRPRPLLIANADLVAPRDGGLSIEPGYYGHLLADSGIENIRFFGKPFPEVFAMLEATLPTTDPERIVMCGDTLHTDILGAATRGWRTVLVTRDGLFAGHDTRKFCERAKIHPDWSVLRI